MVVQGLCSGYKRVVVWRGSTEVMAASVTATENLFSVSINLPIWIFKTVEY